MIYETNFSVGKARLAWFELVEFLLIIVLVSLVNGGNEMEGQPVDRVVVLPRVILQHSRQKS